MSTPPPFRSDRVRQPTGLNGYCSCNLDQPELPDAARIDQSFGFLHRRQEAVVLRHHERDARRFGIPNHSLGVGHGASNRLLHQHGLAGAEGERRVLPVQVVRRADVHRVHPGVGYRVFVAPESVQPAEPRGVIPSPVPDLGWQSTGQSPRSKRSRSARTPPRRTHNREQTGPGSIGHHRQKTSLDPDRYRPRSPVG